MLSENGRLYAGTEESGLYLSSDQGQNWSESNPNLNNKKVNDIVSHHGKLFAGTQNSGIYSSIDEGVSWAAAGPQTQTEQINNIFSTDSFLICGGAGQNFISIDVYCCKKFDLEVAKNICGKFFSPQRMDEQYIERGQDYYKTDSNYHTMTVNNSACESPQVSIQQK